MKDVASLVGTSIVVNFESTVEARSHGQIEEEPTQISLISSMMEEEPGLKRSGRISACC